MDEHNQPQQTPLSQDTQAAAPISVTQPVGAMGTVTASRTAVIKAILIKALLTTLVGAAFIAVIAILIGSMNDIVWNAVGTVMSAAIHITLLFAIISMNANDNPRTQKSTDFIINASMVIAILSFFTSVFGVWGVLDGELSWKLYATYAVALFAMLHAKTLMDVSAVYDKVRPYVSANYILIALTSILILIPLYIPDGFELLDTFYGRLLAAIAIVNVTVGMVVAVMQRLHLQRHPELQEKQNVGGSSVVKIILAILLFVFVVMPIASIAMFLGGL